MPSSKPQLALADIVENIDAIFSYTNGMDESVFGQNKLVRDAVERCLSRISEAAIKLGDQADKLAPGQPWHDVRGLGNWLRHDYRGVRETDIWTIVSEDLTPLRAACVAAIETIESSRHE